MKVKMVDVARYLGVSKATVSLAVNNKPGVNEQTRQKILRCIVNVLSTGFWNDRKDCICIITDFRDHFIVIIHFQKVKNIN